MATINELNDLIVCHLCGGYLIDATTIIECLHSFCRTCIVNHIDSNTPKSRLCPYPKCDLQIHKTKPKLNIRSDPTLQDIVYKIVPGLFKNEMDRRKQFYAREPQSAVGLSNEERGIISGERLIFTPHDTISLSIEYFPQVICYSLLPFSKCLGNGSALNSGNIDTVDSYNNQRRYLQCEGGMRVLHLKKWLRSKYELKDSHDIEIMYKHDPLVDEYTMMDLAYIYSWRRNGPLCLYYKIIEPQPQPQQTVTKNDLIITAEQTAATTTATQSNVSFAAPHQMLAKRSHTFKHRHNNCGNVLAISKKKKKIKKKILRKNGLNGVTNGAVHESNLITTNPVNEPLTPVDTSLINKVVANNISVANIELINSIASLKQKMIPNNNNNNNNNSNTNSNNTSPTNNSNSNTKQLIRVI